MGFFTTSKKNPPTTWGHHRIKEIMYIKHLEYCLAHTMHLHVGCYYCHLINSSPRRVSDFLKVLQLLNDGSGPSSQVSHPTVHGLSTILCFLKLYLTTLMANI